MNEENIQKESKFNHDDYESALSLMSEGLSDRDITTKLIKRGLKYDKAKALIEHLNRLKLKAKNYKELRYHKIWMTLLFIIAIIFFRYESHQILFSNFTSTSIITSILLGLILLMIYHHFRLYKKLKSQLA